MASGVTAGVLALWISEQLVTKIIATALIVAGVGLTAVAANGHGLSVTGIWITEYEIV